jgi:hypothetical protein
MKIKRRKGENNNKKGGNSKEKRKGKKRRRTFIGKCEHKKNTVQYCEVAGVRVSFSKAMVYFTFLFVIYVFTYHLGSMTLRD